MSGGRSHATCRRADDDFVVIDELDENKHIADQMGAPFLLGRPSDDEMLRAAGVERAISVLACVDSDAENIFTCLTARELRNEITIVARASVEDSEKKLLRAGANRVISPYKSSGAEMARLALQPQVTGVVDVAPEYRMEEIDVAEGCEAAGRTDRRGPRDDHGRRGSRLRTARSTRSRPPRPCCTPGDVLVAMGTVEALEQLESTVRPAPGRRVRHRARRPRLARLVGRGQLQPRSPRRSPARSAVRSLARRLPVESVEQRAEQRGGAEVADLDPAELVGDDRQQAPDRRRRSRRRSSRSTARRTWPWASAAWLRVAADR